MKGVKEMDERLLSRNILKEYSKYYFPILFFAVILLIVLMISFSNLSASIVSPSTGQNMISEIRYEFVGVQALNFSTFILACVLPISIALIMGTYEKNNKAKLNEELAIGDKNLLASKIISGSLFVILPFLANVILYFILIISGFFSTATTDTLVHMLVMNFLGIAMGLLTFMLITIINMSIKNSVIDSLLTLAITLFVTHVFYHTSIPVILIIAIIFFVWLALIYLGYSMNKKEKAKQ